MSQKDRVLASILDRFWSILEPKMGPKFDQKSIKKVIEKLMRKWKRSGASWERENRLYKPVLANEREARKVIGDWKLSEEWKWVTRPGEASKESKWAWHEKLKLEPLRSHRSLRSLARSLASLASAWPKMIKQISETWPKITPKLGKLKDGD